MGVCPAQATPSYTRPLIFLTAKLNLYDIVHTPGVAADLSHIETKAATTGYVGADVTEAKYFATPVVLGPGGVEKNLGLGTLSEFEQGLLAGGIPELKGSIAKGEKFAEEFSA